METDEVNGHFLSTYVPARGERGEGEESDRERGEETLVRCATKSTSSAGGQVCWWRGGVIAL